MILLLAHIEYRLTCQTFAECPAIGIKSSNIFIPMPASILLERDIMERVIRGSVVIPEKNKTG